MASVPLDPAKVARARELAARIAGDVQRYIDAHTTVGVERTVLRAYGADGVDDQGVPLVNAAVERYQKAGLLGRGIAYFLARALSRGAGDVQEAA
ncbi:MAG: D-lysine 5,6-aminomutase subunit alpha, partial [Myxococcales bacterium]|nr:D-lysine 5,6-aminomutase subunit alpha [Myxococcales bacterium]